MLVEDVISKKKKYCQEEKIDSFSGVYFNRNSQY